MFERGNDLGPLRVCFRKLLTPSPPDSIFIHQNKTPLFQFSSGEKFIYPITLAHTLLRMSLALYSLLSLTWSSSV